MKLTLKTLLCYIVLAPSLLVGQTSIASVPAGILSAVVPAGTTSLACPFVAPDLFVGVITANTDNTLTFSAGSVGAQLTAGGKYYVEIVTGPLEGDRFDLKTSATMAAGDATAVLDLRAASHSTMTALGSNVLAQARAVIRPHITLARLATMFSPALVGNNSVAKADSVQLYVDGMLRVYYLRGDGRTWREAGKSEDESNRVLPCDGGLLLQIKSGPKRWIHTGAVRTNAFRVNLRVGEQPFASGFPLDLSPVQLGAFVDLNMPANVRWVGNDSVALADTFKVFDATSGVFKTYQLLGDGSSWHRLDQAGNFATQPVVSATGLVLLTRKNADPDYLIVPPFTL